MPRTKTPAVWVTATVEPESDCLAKVGAGPDEVRRHERLAMARREGVECAQGEGDAHGRERREERHLGSDQRDERILRWA